MLRKLRIEPLECRELLSVTSWNGGSGNWDQASNWSNGLPTSTSTVTINPSSAAMIAILSGESFSVGSLTLGSNATLTIGPAPAVASLMAGSISSSGTIVVGALDPVTVNGSFTQTSSGVLDLKLGGPPSGGQYGTVTVSGAASLAGTLRADLVNGYAPATTDSFTPMTFASESGSFSTYTLPSGSGYQFAGTVSFTNVVLSAAPMAGVTTTVNAGSDLHSVATGLLGVNTDYWDSYAVTTQTEAAATAAGLNIYRYPGGAATDLGFHFDVADNLGDSAAISLAQFSQFVAAVNGGGMVTIDYGSGSPQEAAAELAYLVGSPSDTTTIGTGIEWPYGGSAWVNSDWYTVGYWASLRAATPLATDDGLNFLRIGHTAPFTSIKYWEIGNEEYGSWETDHHGTAGPGGVSTGVQHDPATYVAFAKQFASLAAEITATAGVPSISIGIDSGDPTGASDGNWTENVLVKGKAIGFVPGFISDHNYVQEPGSESDYTLLNDTVTDAASVHDWTTRYADYESVLQETVGNQSSAVQVMATEYNSVSNNPGKQSTSLVNGLFVASALGGLLDSGYSEACFWNLRNYWDTGENNSNLLYGWRIAGDYGLFGSTSNPPDTGPYVGYPDYYALELVSKIIVAGGEVVSASSNYGELDAYSVMESDGDLDLLLVNTNPAATITDQISVAGFQPAGPAEVWQYGKTQDTAQSHSPTGDSSLASTNTTLALSGATFSYSLPAYSMTVLDLKQAPAATPHTTGSTSDMSVYGTAVTISVSAGAAYGGIGSYDDTAAASAASPNAPLGSQVNIVDGSAAAATKVSMAWRTRESPLETASANPDSSSAALPVPNTTGYVLPNWAGGLASDVVQMRGVGVQATDYVLQLTLATPYPVTSSALSVAPGVAGFPAVQSTAGGTTTTLPNATSGKAANLGGIVLGSFTPGYSRYEVISGKLQWVVARGSWVNAASANLAVPAAGKYEIVSGKLQWVPTRVAQPAIGADAVGDYVGSYTQFMSAGQPGNGHALADLRSSWGMDPTTHTVWAILNIPGGGQFGVVAGGSEGEDGPDAQAMPLIGASGRAVPSAAVSQAHDLVLSQPALTPSVNLSWLQAIGQETTQGTSTRCVASGINMILARYGL
ncbi:MAG: hypothetical protein ABSF26_28805 [Thermoguttaceae bacterium]|jgi:hypothetical protein